MERRSYRSGEQRLGVVEVARNMLGSGVAKALLEDRRFPERALELRLRRIGVECRLTSNIQDNRQRVFRKNVFIYNYQPSMVVERLGGSVRRPQGTADDEYQVVAQQAPAMDAFKAVKRRQKNVWETDGTANHLTATFRSVLTKSPRLSATELQELSDGWDAYRPVSRTELRAQQKLNGRREERRRLARSVKRSPTTAPSVFVTELDADHDDKIDASRRKLTAMAASAEKLRELRVAREFDKLRSSQKQKYHKYIR